MFHYLLQNWTIEFEQTLRELRIAVLQVNSTCLDLSLTEGFSTWISAAFSYFKEWVGVDLFGVAVCGGVLLLLWMICKLKAQTRRDRMVVTQALVALEHGASPIYDYQCSSNKVAGHPAQVLLHGAEQVCFSSPGELRG